MRILVKTIICFILFMIGSICFVMCKQFGSYGLGIILNFGCFSAMVAVIKYKKKPTMEIDKSTKSYTDN